MTVSTEIEYLFPEERRMATVLFADVQGFTPLSEQVDFELVSDLVKDVWLRLDEVIETYGGYIDKHIGDAVMAVWGVPYARENDAEQAVKAGLALLHSFDEVIKDCSLPGSDALKLRVAINSGMVYSGYVGKRPEYTVMGDTVNIASRLQEEAEPGSVVCSEATYRLVRGVFKVRRLASPLQLRGKTEAIQAFLIDSAASQTSRLRYQSLDTLQTYMVGRETELHRLTSLYQLAVQEEKPSLVLVTGEAGLGKSRLLMEFTSQLEADEVPPAVIATRALAQASQVPFYLWKSLLFLRFSLQENDPPEVSREKLLREIQKLWGFQLGPASSVEVAHLIGSLIGLNWPESPYIARFEGQPTERLGRAFELMRELFRRMCAYQPLVLLLDDLQFADDSSLDLLAFLLDACPFPMPVLALGGARPEFASRNPFWMNVASLVELEPLPVNADIVAAAYPILRPLPEEVLVELAERADGNPYFLEEMVKSLIKSGMEKEGLPVEEMLVRLRSNPPESLRVMLQARLDALPREARAVSLLASVVGRVFWVGAVASAAQITETSGLFQGLTTEEIETTIQEALRQLVRAELAFPRADSSFSSDQEYIFKHSLLREVAYGLIPLKMRPRYHLAVAHWLSKHRNPDLRLMAANQYELGGSPLEAARHFQEAAEAALLRGATHESDELMKRAMQLRTSPDSGETSVN